MTLGRWAVVCGLAIAVPVAVAQPEAMSGRACGREHSLSVTGVGRVSVAPDTAHLSLSVSVQDKTAAAARKNAAEAMTKVLAALKDQGLADRDLQTRWVSLYPVYASNTPNLVIGYQLQNRIEATVRDVSRAGAVMDAAVQAGGDAVRLDGVGFSLADPAAAEARARALAAADAQTRAKQYGELLQVTVGKPIRITESVGGAAPPPVVGLMRSMKAAAEAPTPVEAGEQDITVTVNVAFAIE